MVVSVKISGDLNQDKTIIEEVLDDLKDEHLRFSDEVLESEIKQGFPEDFRFRTDGVIDKSPFEVKDFGKIEFINVSQLDFADAVKDAYKAIVDRSPIGGAKPNFPSVKYIKFNAVFFNDVLVAQTRPQVVRWAESLRGRQIPDGSVIRFVNLVPYARKLARRRITRNTSGAEKGRNTSAKVVKRRSKRTNSIVTIPNGTYEKALRSIKNIFKGKGTVSNVKYVPLNISVGGMRSTFAKSRRNGSGAGRPYLYPSISIRIDNKGFKRNLRIVQ